MLTTVLSMPGLVGQGTSLRGLAESRAVTVTTMNISDMTLGQPTATGYQTRVVLGSTTTGTGVSCGCAYL